MSSVRRWFERFEPGDRAPVLLSFLGIVLDFAVSPDHSPPDFDWEGALWRRKKCSNFREW
jgi:hypothetical protein